jgi:beta-phosphoglucomutase-like phosphatase (HAD superfamily)
MMPDSATIPRSAQRRGSRVTAGLVQALAQPQPEKPSLAESHAQRLELDTLTAQWQRALDSDQRALAAATAARSLPAHELAARQRQLRLERPEVAASLARLARVAGVRPTPWLPSGPVTTTSLGLPAGVKAGLFDLDGVLTDSGVFHAWAWGEVFDELLLRLSEKIGWHFIPFDRVSDYRAYIEGRPRLDGVHAFLLARGIRLPEGRVDDPADAETAHGLARRKGEVVERGLRRGAVNAVAGARRYLEAAGFAGLGRATVSASASTLAILEQARLGSLVETRIDAALISAEQLRSPPAPDFLIVACRHLGVRPDEAVYFTHTPAGVAAAHTARIAVVGVGDEDQRELLSGFGAERTVSSLSALLDSKVLR